MATMGRFTDKHVLVTGAAGALGAVVAQKFHGAGALVTGVDIVAHDAPWNTVVANLLDPVDAVRATRALGDVDILANIAGGFAMGEPVAETPDETWDSMMDLNVRTMLNTCRAVVPGMVAQGGGKIVNIGARGALRGAANMGAYIAAKSVVMRLTETLAEEHKRDGVNVNCILPSIIDTPQNRADMPDARFDEWVPPAHIAAVVLFLASEAADSIHGAAIPVEGLS